MRTGISLPIAAPEAALEWARRIEAGPFDTVAVFDRLVYPCPDPLITLAALAGVTSRVTLRSQVLLGALRDPVVLAKQAATLDLLSGGRFELGLGLGDREDDYAAVGLKKSRRGRLLDAGVERLLQVWPGSEQEDVLGPVAPRPASPGGPKLLFGGYSDAALRRVARWGGGYISNMVPDAEGSVFRKVEAQWAEAGRPGRPQLLAQVNVAIGSPEVVEEARRHLTAYYAFLDYPGSYITSQKISDWMVTSEQQLQYVLQMCRQSGADELVFMCWSPDLGQVDRLASLLG